MTDWRRRLDRALERGVFFPVGRELGRAMQATNYYRRTEMMKRWSEVKAGDIVVLPADGEFPSEKFRVRSALEYGAAALEPLSPDDGDDFFEWLAQPDDRVEVDG